MLALVLRGLCLALLSLAPLRFLAMRSFSFYTLAFDCCLALLFVRLARGVGPTLLFFGPFLRGLALLTFPFEACKTESLLLLLKGAPFGFQLGAVLFLKATLRRLLPLKRQASCASRSRRRAASRSAFSRVIWSCRAACSNIVIRARASATWIEVG